MNSDKKKLYLGLIVYVVTMAMLLISRLFDFYELWTFCLTALILTLFCICTGSWRAEEEIKLKERQRRIYSALVFTSWLLVAVPLILLGDYVTGKTMLGWDVAFLSQGFSAPVLWIGSVFSAIAYEMFFRGFIYRAFSGIIGKKAGAVVSCLCFTMFFMDLRISLAVLLLNLAQIAIGRISAKNRYLFSVLGAVCIVVILTVLSGESSGADIVGLWNIIGMLLMFTDIAFVIVYMMQKDYSKREASYIETLVVIILAVLVLLIGCLFVTA